MNNESKSDSNNLQSFYSISPEDASKHKEFSSSYAENNKASQKELKSAGSNAWNSVPVMYDKEESMKEHEKTATNNQWTSTHK